MKIDEFIYLRSTIQSNEQSTREIKKKVQAGWSAWKQVSEMICDKGIAGRVKVKVSWEHKKKVTFWRLLTSHSRSFFSSKTKRWRVPGIWTVVEIVPWEGHWPTYVHHHMSQNVKKRHGLLPLEVSGETDMRTCPALSCELLRAFLSSASTEQFLCNFFSLVAVCVLILKYWFFSCQIVVF